MSRQQRIAGVVALAMATLLVLPAPARAGPEDPDGSPGAILADGGAVWVQWLGSTAYFHTVLYWFHDFPGNPPATGTISQRLMRSDDGGANGWAQAAVAAGGEHGSGSSLESEKADWVPLLDPNSTGSWGGQAPFEFRDRDEVIFGFHVYNLKLGTDKWYFSGDPSRNVDDAGVAHVRYSSFNDEGGRLLRVEFEDLDSDGSDGYRFDGDYDDFVFASKGVHVQPEPISLLLMGTGLAGVAGVGGAARRRRREDEEGTA